MYRQIDFGRWIHEIAIAKHCQTTCRQTGGTLSSENTKQKTKMIKTKTTENIITENKISHVNKQTEFRTILLRIRVGLGRVGKGSLGEK